MKKISLKLSLSVALLTLALTACNFGSNAGSNGAVSSSNNASCSAGDGKTVKTATEVQYENLTVCNGPALQSGQTVVVNYKSFIKDGSNQTPFKSTYDTGKPVTFKVGAGQVIRGLEEGVIGMQAGAKRRLTLTPALGYGPAGGDGAPPNATLIYEVEVLEIRN